MMKTVIFISLLLFSVPAHAYTLKGCVQSDHGNWECTYHLRIGIATGPQNPVVDVTLGASDPELTKSAAKKITDQMAYEVEHPDQKSIDDYTAKVISTQEEQKLAANLLAKQIQKSANFINPETSKQK